MRDLILADSRTLTFLAVLAAHLAMLTGALLIRYHGLPRFMRRGIDWNRVSDPQGLSLMVSNLLLLFVFWKTLKILVWYFVSPASALHAWIAAADGPIVVVLVCAQLVAAHRYQDKPLPLRKRDERR